MNIYHIGKWALTNYVLLFVIVGCFSSDMVKIWWIFLPYTIYIYGGSLYPPYLRL